MNKKKLFRITTVPISIEKLLGNQLTYMNRFFVVTAISSDRKELEKIGKELGIKTYSIEMTRQITPIRDFRSLYQMYRFFKKEKPEIVHTHTPKAGLIGMLAAKLAGVKIRLHTVAGLPLMETSGIKRQILNFVEKLTYSCATNIYPNSFGLHHFILKEKFCKKEKLKVIGNAGSNGIDIEYFNPLLISEQQKLKLKTELKISAEDFVFIFVGRLVKDKGINELIHAFDNLSISDSKLLLVGNFESELNPLFPDTLRLIKENPNIISVGYQKDVRDYFAISDALVFPSYREGFPNVVLQAGAIELPAIVTDINGCNEIIENEVNGIIIPPKDEFSLKNAMLRIVNDEYLRLTLKKNSRQIIVSRYEQKQFWKALLVEYQNLILKV